MLGKIPEGAFSFAERIATADADVLQCLVVENIDFDILLAGHGVPGKNGTAIGTKENITEFREYFEALYAKILEAHDQGLSKEQAIASIELPQFKHLGMYDQWFKLNVSGMWRHMYGE